MFGGDLLLADITPNVGRWPETAPDPLGVYLQSLEEISGMAPRRLSRPRPRDHRRRRARGRDRRHHAERLDEHVAALRTGADTAFDVSRVVWPGDMLSFHEQRFALVESLSHLERLVAEGRATTPAPGHWRAL